MVNIFLHYFHFYASKFCTFLKHSIRSTVLFIFLIHKNASVQKLPYTFWSNTSQKMSFFFKSGLYIEIYFFASQTCCFFLNATGIFRCSWERASNKILDLSWNRWVFFFKNQLRFTGLLIPFYLDFVKLSNYLTRKTQQPIVLLYTNEILK